VQQRYLSFAEEERFFRLSELPEDLQRMEPDFPGDKVLQALAWNLFAGAFDPPEGPAAPPRYGYDAWARVQTLAVPAMSTMDLKFLERGHSGFIGGQYRYGCRRDVAWLLAQAKQLPLEPRPFKTAAELDAICDALVELPIERFSEPARDLLDQILVAKRLIGEWCVKVGLEGGLHTPAEQPEGTRGRTPRQQPDSCNTGPGRPQSDFWPRAQELVTSLHLTNPDRYGNEIALAVHAQLAREFPGEKIIALSTLERRMKDLRDIARQSIERHSRPKPDCP